MAFSFRILDGPIIRFSKTFRWSKIKVWHDDMLVYEGRPASGEPVRYEVREKGREIPYVIALDGNVYAWTLGVWRDGAQVLKVAYGRRTKA
ncbi:MAG: hypothetical protein V4510_06710 [bacterium]